MYIGTLSQVIHENVIKDYYQKIHKHTPEAKEDKWLAKVSGNRLADKHGKHPVLGAIPGALAGGLLVGGLPAVAAGAAGGMAAQYLKRKLHEYGDKKDK